MGRLATYALRVDWNQDSDFTSTYDDVTNDVLLEGPSASEGVTVSGQGRDQARALAPPQTSVLNFKLVNDDRLYSIEDASSALASQVRPGRDVELTATYGEDWLMDDPGVLMDDPDFFIDGEATVGIFRGAIDQLDQESALGQRTLEIHAHGRIARLEGLTAATILYTNITTGTAMGHLLTAGGLSASEYSISADVIANGRMLAYWYGDGSSVEDQARLLWSTEGYSAFFGEDEDGVIIFEGRNDRTLATRSQEVQATFEDTPTALYHVGLRIMPGLREIINHPHFEIVLRAFQSVAEIWAYSPVITLDADGAASVIATPDDPFRNAVTPSTGGGDFTLSAGVVTVTLERTSGGSTMISFTAGTPGATISALRLRADAYTETASVHIETSLDTSASIAEFGEQFTELDVHPGLAPTDAVALADSMVLAYQELRPTIDVDVINVDQPHLAQILTRRVGDRIHLIDDYQGIDLDVTIEQKAHRIMVGRLHQVRWGCEKVVEQDWALYDVGLYDAGLFGQ